MAKQNLITCHNCPNTRPADSENCPHCGAGRVVWSGAPRTSRTTSSGAKIAGVIFLLVIGTIIFGGRGLEKAAGVGETDGAKQIAEAATPRKAPTVFWNEGSVSDYLGKSTGISVSTTCIGGIDGRIIANSELSIQCFNNSTTVMLTIPGMGVIDDVQVSYTLDDGPTKTATWNICKDFSCIGQWQGSGIPFARSLIGHQDLKMVIGRRYGSDMVARCAVEGAASFLKRVAKPCGWDSGM